MEGVASTCNDRRQVGEKVLGKLVGCKVELITPKRYLALHSGYVVRESEERQSLFAGG